MNTTQAPTMIQFKRVTPEDRGVFEKYINDGTERGCEFSFANLVLWGRQNFAVVDDHIVLVSQFDRRSVYPYPVGAGDAKGALDAIIEDSRARGIPCRITGVRPSQRQVLDELYPNRFRFHCDEGSFDYVYDINDLADLKGKKYHSKRNHYKRFAEAYPEYTVRSITSDHLEAARQFVSDWYDTKQKEMPNGDYHMEKAAIDKAFRFFDELRMEGIMIMNGDEVLALTMGSPMSESTFDVQFEKARADVNGAYAAVNREFANYIREKYPNVLFLDREEDMGLEGLRKAKRSYYPHHMIEKCWACLLEDGYDY